MYGGSLLPNLLFYLLCITNLFHCCVFCCNPLLCKQNLTQERDLLKEKLEQILTEDAANPRSADLKLYAVDEELPLSTPSQTMAIVMNFVQHNNTLLEQIDDLQDELQLKHADLERSQRLAAELRLELQQIEQRNKLLSRSLRTTSAALDRKDQSNRRQEEEVILLREKLDEMANAIQSLTRENRALVRKHTTSTAAY